MSEFVIQPTLELPGYGDISVESLIKNSEIYYIDVNTKYKFKLTSRFEIGCGVSDLWSEHALIYKSGVKIDNIDGKEVRLPVVFILYCGKLVSTRTTVIDSHLTLLNKIGDQKIKKYTLLDFMKAQESYKKQKKEYDEIIHQYDKFPEFARLALEKYIRDFNGHHGRTVFELKQEEKNERKY